MAPGRWTLAVVLLAGLVVGNLVSGLPHVENDLCTNTSEGASSDGGLQLWPFGTWCEFEGATRQEDAVHAAGTLEGLAWTVGTVLLFAGALVTRSPAARGAVTAAGLLALISFGWHYTEAIGAFWFMAFFGGPMAVAVDRLLRPRHERSWTTAMLAIIILPVILSSWLLFDFTGYPYVAVAAALLVGAFAGSTAERANRRRPVPA